MPFDPAAVIVTEVGSGTLTFSDINNGSFAYAVFGVTQTKLITRQVFGPVPACTWGTPATWRSPPTTRIYGGQRRPGLNPAGG